MKNCRYCKENLTTDTSELDDYEIELLKKGFCGILCFYAEEDKKETVIYEIITENVSKVKNGNFKNVMNEKKEMIVNKIKLIVRENYNFATEEIYYSSIDIDTHEERKNCLTGSLHKSEIDEIVKNYLDKGKAVYKNGVAI